MTVPKIIKGSILDFDGDAIVNPANGFLTHGGGLARIIANAATSPSDVDYQIPDRMQALSRWENDHARLGRVPTGGADVTGPGLLPFEGVIHAVGPIWGGGHLYERELLASAHVSALAIATAKGWERIAFPAISCGVFHFPVTIAAPIAVQTVAKCDTVETTFYLFSDEHYDAFAAALKRLDT